MAIVPENRDEAVILAIAERVIKEGEEENDDLACESYCELCHDLSRKVCVSLFKSLCMCCSKDHDADSVDTITIQEASALSRKARKLGIKFLFLDGVIFPLLPHLLRDIVVGGELLYVIAALIVSVINYVKADCYQIFYLVSFVFGSVAMLLSIASTFEAFSMRFRKCFHNKKGTSGLEELINLLRNVLAELLIYPVLICSIFSLVTARPFSSRNVEDILVLIQFGLCAISFIAFVYILRLVILAGAIFKIKKAKTTGTLVYFFIHVALQMIVQSFMIVVTGREIYEENIHFYTSTSILSYTNYTCLSVKISGYLWYMIIGSYLFPIMGTMISFVVGYCWMQPFFLRIFKMSLNKLKTCKHIDDFDKVNQAVYMQQELP